MKPYEKVKSNCFSIFRKMLKLSYYVNFNNAYRVSVVINVYYSSNLSSLNII